MKSRKPRRLPERLPDSAPPRKATAVPADAPGFLVRLVGKSRAKTLCQAGVIQPRRD